MTSHMTRAVLSSPWRGRPGGERATVEASTSCPPAPCGCGVYSGMDPISKRRMYCIEVVPPGPKAGDEAEKVAPGCCTRSTRNAIRAPEQRRPAARQMAPGPRRRLVDPAELRGLAPQVHPVRARITTAGPARRRNWTPFYAELRRCREHWTAGDIGNTGPASAQLRRARRCA